MGGTGNLSGIVAVAAGRFHALALSASGVVYAWGVSSGNLVFVPMARVDAALR